MAVDVDIAKALATGIGALPTFPATATARFTFDRYIENDAVQNLEIRVCIDSESRERLARGNALLGWRRNVFISVVMLSPTLIVKSDGTHQDTEIEQQFDIWDSALNFIQGAEPNGKKASSIEPLTEGRVDFDKLQNHNQFRAGVLVQFSNV